MGFSIFGLDTGINIQKVATGGAAGGIGFWITIVLIIILFLISAVIIFWMIYQNKIFNKTIVVFENIGGQGYQLTGKDRARVIKVGDGGEEILFLRKRKVYRTAYGRKMGKNNYWFAIGQDGYWYNFLLGDLDAKMGTLDIEPIDRDMRYMHVAIRKNIQERYNKQSFMQKYGQMLMSGIFLLIMIIAIWLLINQVGDLIKDAKPVAEALRQASESMLKATGNWDNICSGGSGIIPVA